jgi:hypothetical protein
MKPTPRTMHETTDDAPQLEPVYLAGNIREVGFIEDLLKSEGIDYCVRPEAFTQGTLTAGACFQGLLFEVLPGQADYCRRLFESRDLRTGIIPPE